MKLLLKLLAFVVVLATMESCEKEILPNPNPQTMDDLIIMDAFNWGTTTDYNFTIHGTVNRVIMITSPDGSVYKKGMLTASQPYIVNLSLPTYEKTVYLKYNGKVVSVQLTTSTIVYSFI
jgi:hypothetical protein